MSNDCPEVVSLSNKQKSMGKASPPKNICQPFTLRLVLGVPILKEDVKVYNDMENMFARYTQNDNMSSSNAAWKAESDLFWSHFQTGLNTVVKMLEDAVREPNVPKYADPFSVVLLDFAWLNSQLGHHLAHICSGTPHTSLLAVNPPGKLAELLNSQTKVVCAAIRPLMHPNTNRLPYLRDFLRACAGLAGKSLPPDPAAPTNSLVVTTGGATGGAIEAALGGSAGVPTSTPQYVPILPKPPVSASAATAAMLVSPHPGVDITASSSGYIVAASAPTSNILANTLIGAPRASHPRQQMPPKPVPRPAVRHIPADDWLTYRLDHSKLYKCGGDISKELENHSLYIHDVDDIWNLYPRSLIKPGPSELGGGGSTPGGGSGLRRKAGSSMLTHGKGRSSSSAHPPPPKSRRTHHGHVAAPHHHHSSSMDYFDDEEEDEDYPSEDPVGDLDNDVEDDYDDDDYHPGNPSYLSPTPPPQSSSRHSRYSASSSSRHRGANYQRKLQETPPSTYGSGSRRRSRRSPRW